jgi:hypothetical protein
MQLDVREEDSASDLVSSITLALPFETQTYNLCVKEGQGNYIMFNLNNALEHHNIHHHGVQISFLCSRCQKEYRTKHAALCHLPKCPGPAPNLNSGISCEICHQEFRTQRGLSQHERAAHPALRNEKRQQAAQPAPPRPAAKGHGKTWRKEEIDLMIQLELRLKGHPQIAKQMLAHFAGKTNKQIRDKGNEHTYKNLLKAQVDRENLTSTNTTDSATSEDSKSSDTDPPKTTPGIHEPNLDTTNEPSEPIL